MNLSKTKENCHIPSKQAENELNCQIWETKKKEFLFKQENSHACIQILAKDFARICGEFSSIEESTWILVNLLVTRILLKYFKIKGIL